VSEQLDRLGRQLEAIDAAISAIRAEADPTRRALLLEVVDRASIAARTEYQEAVKGENERPYLRLIKGGAVIAAFTSGAEWLRNARRAHPQAAMGTVAAAMTLSTAIAYAGWHQGDASAAPAFQGPRVAATPSHGSALPSRTPSVPRPAKADPSGAPDSSRSIPVPLPGPGAHGLMPTDAGALTPAPSAPPAPPAPTSAAGDPPSAPDGLPGTTPPTASSPPSAAPPPPKTSRPSGLCLGLHLQPVVDVGTCLLTDR
jgi:hypothetical protein